MRQRIIQFLSQRIFLTTIQDSVMTQYDEYLQYLKHVDDTTLQDFEKEKRKLQDDITATKNQSIQKIKSIEDKCKQEIEKQKSACETKISEIKQQFKDKESVLNQTLADATKGYEEEIKSLKNKLSSTRGLFVALIAICSFGILLILYFFYCIFNLKNYFSIKRWIQCDKYDSPWVVKRL